MSNVLRLFDDPPAPRPTQAAQPLGDFEALWKVWPRREGKALARAKYQAILAGGYVSKTMDKSAGQFVELPLAATEADILLGAKRYLESQKARGSGAFGYVDGGKFIPHLATWLGRGAWEDWL